MDHLRLLVTRMLVYRCTVWRDERVCLWVLCVYMWREREREGGEGGAEGERESECVAVASNCLSCPSGLL